METVLKVSAGNVPKAAVKVPNWWNTVIVSPITVINSEMFEFEKNYEFITMHVPKKQPQTFQYEN